MKEIKVSMLLHSYYPIVGGAERQLQSLLPLLKERNIFASVLTRRYKGLSAFEMVDGTPVYRLPIVGPKPMMAASFISSAISHLYRIRPDVIHSYDLMSPTTAALLAKKLFRIPVAAKVLSGGPKGDIDRIRSKINGEKRLRSIARKVDKFIVISREIEAELEAIGANKENFAYIPNGVDLENFTPVNFKKKQEVRQQLGLPTDAVIVIFLGRLIPEKRPDQLLSIWDETRRRFPKAHLVMVGDGSEMKRLRSMQLSGVQFAGQVKNTNMYLQAADIFVLPSAREGLSNALLEAQASGLPVITTAIGAAPELIENGVSGLLINVDDTNALQTSLVKLLENDTLREKLAATGRERVIKNYSIQSTADRLAKLYQQLVETGAK